MSAVELRPFSGTAVLVREGVARIDAECAPAPPEPRISIAACSACLGFVSLPGTSAG